MKLFIYILQSIFIQTPGQGTGWGLGGKINRMLPTSLSGLCYCLLLCCLSCHCSADPNAVSADLSADPVLLLAIRLLPISLSLFLTDLSSAALFLQNPD